MNTNSEIIKYKRIITGKFTEENWYELGLLTDCSHEITSHPRLLRSLSFGDGDYGACVLDILTDITKKRQENFQIVKGYIDETFNGDIGQFISSKKNTDNKKITFAPTVFKIPDIPIEDDRVAAMMPFSGFDNVYKSMSLACEKAKMKIDRADTVWEDSTFIQDIFTLIFKSNVIIVDLTNKNPNVMYEMGIAHTLGRNVIPITQNISDIPSDLGHHRALKYMANTEGLEKLMLQLTERLKQFYSPPKNPFDW